MTMTRLLIGALVTAAAVATPALGQSRAMQPALKLVPIIEPQPVPSRFSLDVARDDRAMSAPKGPRLLIGTDIAPGAAVGLGLFTSPPKRLREDRFELRPKPSRRAGVGVLLRF